MNITFIQDRSLSMANMVKSFLSYLRLNEEDEEELFEEEFEREFQKIERNRPVKEEREVQEREEVAGHKPARATSKQDDRQISIGEIRKERGGKSMDRPGATKVVPIRTTSKGLEVCIMKPSSFEDSQDICDMLLGGRAAVVNLEGFDPLDAQRIMDFISGCVYAINGKLHQISKYIFIFSPDSIDISGDYLEFMPDEGFEVPTLNKDF